MTEDDMRVENATIEIKRHYKQALGNLETVKADVAGLLKVKEKVEEELSISQGELSKVKNDISQEKLNWATQKHEEMVELENKRSEADNVLKRKTELNQQEEVIRGVELKNTETLNETRRLELEIKSKQTDLNVGKKELEEDKKKLESAKAKLSKDKEDFKQKVVLVIKEVENL